MNKKIYLISLATLISASAFAIDLKKMAADKKVEVKNATIEKATEVAKEKIQEKLNPSQTANQQVAQQGNAAKTSTANSAQGRIPSQVKKLNPFKK